jgi:hypothetical protein
MKAPPLTVFANHAIGMTLGKVDFYSFTAPVIDET